MSGESVFRGPFTREPRYRIPGLLTGMPWKTGKMDVEGEAVTYGFGANLLANLHASGSFRGRAVELSGPETWDTANGCFEWAWSPRNSRLKLSQLVLTAGSEIWLGSAETQGDGQLLLNVSNGERRMQASDARSLP